MTPEDSAVAIGIDAEVVANLHIVVRRPHTGSAGEVVDDFVAAPTFPGMDSLTKRLAKWPGTLAMAERTSMTWLPLAVALRASGVELALVGNRHSARLRSALAGKNKSDPIDAEVLSRAGELFDLAAARIPSPTEPALRRAAQSTPSSSSPMVTTDTVTRSGSSPSGRLAPRPMNSEVSRSPTGTLKARPRCSRQAGRDRHALLDRLPAGLVLDGGDRLAPSGTSGRGGRYPRPPHRGR